MHMAMVIGGGFVLLGLCMHAEELFAVRFAV